MPSVGLKVLMQDACITIIKLFAVYLLSALVISKKFYGNFVDSGCATRAIGVSVHWSDLQNTIACSYSENASDAKETLQPSNML